MIFDNPIFKEMVELDNQLLAKGKIDWSDLLLPIASEIKECKNVLLSDNSRFLLSYVFRTKSVQLFR